MTVKRGLTKKIALAISVVAIVSFARAFSFGKPLSREETKYADAKKVLENLANLIETFVTDMDQADNAKNVAEVLDGFAEAMKELLPKIAEIREKYPELDNEDTHPQELKSLLQRIDEDFQSMMKSYGKVKEHLEDPAVKAAEAKYNEVMSELS
jgi:uncharacterized UPF0160 family protein